MTNTCLTCNEELCEDAVFLTCLECHFVYHIGTCSGVNEAAYKKKTESAKKAWKCPTCKTAKARSNQSGKKTSEEPEANLASEIADIRLVLTEVLKIKSKIDTLGEIKATVDGIEQFMQEMATKYDEVLSKIKQQDADMSALGKRVEKLEARVTEQENQELRQQVNELEQYSRRQNLEIVGLPYHDNENLLEKLNVLATDVELPPLSEADVEAVHRLPSRSINDIEVGDSAKKVASVLVRFVSRSTRDAWLAKKGQLKETKSKIFFNENLTAQNKALFWKMKKMAKEKEYVFAWLKNGKMFVRRGPRSRAIRIRTTNDLDKIR
ncbi:uncharacterized protein LOC142590857 [Dermacentor variabilis]|uniref:uncharacterized protein LOC142590857 n=1 Tax=Dermacentor variabilis TaxID=34621 RepID=UPI003F5B26D7